MSDKKIADLGIDELKEQKKKSISRKEYFEALYSTLKNKLRDAKRMAYTEKKFLPPKEYRDLETKMKEHLAEIRKTELLVSEINHEIKKREAFIFERLFVDECRESLPIETWTRIFDKVKLKMLKA